MDHWSLFDQTYIIRFQIPLGWIGYDKIKKKIASE